LKEEFLSLQNNTEVRCVVLLGGEKAFCAGADLKEYLDATTQEISQKKMEIAWDSIRRCQVPVIAAVRGFALGGGCELALLADIVIAGQSAIFGQPEVLVGLMPGGGATQRLIRLIGKARAMDLLLTGRRIKANEALAIGMISRIVEDLSVEEEALNVASQIADGPAASSRLIKQVMLDGADAPLATGLALESKSFQVLFSSRDKREGIQAFLEKRTPEFE